MKIVSSYKVKIKNYNQIFEQTIAIYRSALSMVIDIFNKEWEAIMEVESAGNKRKGFAEQEAKTAPMEEERSTKNRNPQGT